MRHTVIVWLSALIVVLAGCVDAASVSPSAPTATPLPTPVPVSPGQTVLEEPRGVEVTVVQSGLLVPWDLAFTPDGRMIVTEREGRIRVYASFEPGAELLATHTIPDVLRLGEGGALGIAVDPDFSAYPYAYICATRDIDGEDGPAPTINELLRYRVGMGGDLSLDGPPLVTGMRAHRNHNGCAVEMDTSGHIWLTMGDANTVRSQQLSQKTSSLNGRTLRINRDGTPPPDNPILPGLGAPTASYTMGQRNPQGLAIRSEDGLVLTVEHGTDRDDEINRILAGANYGYGCYSGSDTIGPALEQEGAAKEACGELGDYVPPAWSSGFPTIAPSGATFLVGEQWGEWEGSLIVSVLKEMDLRRFEVINGGESVVQREILLDNAFGRLRAATIAPDGSLYITTSNNADDRVLRVVRAEPGS